MERWNAEEAVDLIDRHGLAMTISATTFLQELLDAAERKGTRLPSLKVFACGGASVPLALVRRANSSLENCRAFRVYGATEVPLIGRGCVDPGDDATAADTDGIIVDFEVRITGDRGDQVPDGVEGEILARGPCVMQGYYKNPAATREVLSTDGWFSTGDIGYLDDDGYLFITDRKKDLIKTAAGKFVAPQPIENLLKSSPYLLNAMVVGDERKYVVALLVPNPVTISAKAADEGIKFGSNAEMASSAWVHALIELEMRRLTAHLAQYESIKRFALLPEDFTFDNGSLTFTLKLKRRNVERHYRKIIDELYSDTAEPRPMLQD